LKTLMKIFVFLLVICSITYAQKTIYVDDDANGLNDGSSWLNAYKFLQDALMMASVGDDIRVAQGIYKPDQFALSDRPSLGQAETFQLKSGVAIRGGYAGFGAPDPNTRNIEAYRTILSGDLGGNDSGVTDPCDLLDHPTRSDNSYHVVTADGAEPNAILDGFIITGGNAYREWPIYYGGGMFIESGSPTILNCTLNGNAAAQGGGLDIHSGSPKLINCTISNNAAIHAGGMLNGGSNTTLTNCAFIRNFAATSGGGTICTYAIMTGCTFIHNFAGYKGGGIDNDCSAPILNNCVFIENTAGDHGGGLSNYEGDLIITDCTFTGNWSRYGGAIYQGDTDTILTGCRFAGNSAQIGGGIANDGYSDPTLTNCIFSGNSAEIGAGFYNTTGSAPKFVNCTFAANLANQTGGGMCITNNYNFRPILLSCILWGNTDDSGMGQSGQISFQDGTPIINYCLLQGWTGSLGGAGNIDADPCFAAPDNGDYHLKSQAGRWDSNSTSWIKDNVTSPCIDAGEPSGPIGLEPFPNGGIINMGAYGGTTEASKSYFGEPPCETIVAGDINGDCIVNLKDFALMAFHWLEERQ
jgi:hypothetical protein